MTLFSKMKSCISGVNKSSSDSLKRKNNGIKSIDGAEFLMHANSELEANILESKLKLYGIPVLKEYGGSGLYSRIISGGALLGVEIYVPAGLLAEAKNIISEGIIIEEEK
jgi:hypothetical protein